MPNSYWGKILRVNLSNRAITVEEPDELFYRRYVGGPGIAAYYILKEVPATCDPLGPENKLVFAGGPITGTLIPAAARNEVAAKSPLTGAFGKTEVGGYWGAELRRSGFDAVIVEGVADSPVYISIKDGEAEIRDASAIWGMPTLDAQNAIRAELRDRLVRTALIGPAGEKKVLISAIINDVAGHASARGGLAAVMGAKNLKGLVARGRRTPETANPERMREILKIMDLPTILQRARSTHEFGTGVNLLGGNATGNLPVRNYGDGDFPTADKIQAEAVKSTYELPMESCYACAIRCKKTVERLEGKFTFSRHYGGPEYETLASMGSVCGVDDLDAVCKANELCNALGLDTISAGMTVGFAMECFENGIITTADTGGLDLRFGNAEAMVRAIEMIGKREGIGDILALGSRQAALRFGKGAIDYAMQVKGMEIPMHEPRLKQGLGLHYAVHPMGADHMSGTHDTAFDRETPQLAAQRSLGRNYDPMPLNDLSPVKVNLVRDYEMWRSFYDCMVMCDFGPWTFAECVDMMKAATGWDYSLVEALRVGERVIDMMKAFNYAAGIGADQDWLPKRFFSPTPRGALRETAIDPEAFRKAIQTYYFMAGWTPEGVPTAEKMAEMGISWVADQYNLPSALETRVPVSRSGA